MQDAVVKPALPDGILHAELAQAQHGSAFQVLDEWNQRDRGLAIRLAAKVHVIRHHTEGVNGVAAQGGAFAEGVHESTGTIRRFK